MWRVIGVVGNLCRWYDVFMQQSVQHQADGDIPPQAVDCDGEQAAIIDKDCHHETALDTPAGEVEWKQAKLD